MRELVTLIFLLNAGCATTKATLREPAAETHYDIADKERLSASKSKLEMLKSSTTPILCVCRKLDVKNNTFGKGAGAIGVIRYFTPYTLSVQQFGSDPNYQNNQTYDIAACQLASDDGAWIPCTDFEVLQ